MASSGLTILLDMDGVVSHFTAALAALTSDYQDLLWPERDDLCGNYGFASNDDLWQTIDRAGQAFWQDMPVMPWAQELYDVLRPYSVVFCTSPAYNPVCAAGKMAWLQRFTGDRALRDVVITPRKELLARPRSILIDDLERNVRKFRTAGGQAILFPAPYNSMRGQFDPSGRPQIRYVQTEIERLALGT